MIRRCSVILAVTIASQVIPCDAQSVLEQIEREVSAIVRQARPGVVTIEGHRGTSDALTRSLKGDPSPKTGTDGSSTVKPEVAAPRIGSGFVIEPEFVITTADVIEGISNPIVTLENGQRFRAIVVQIDHELNIGLLRLPESAFLKPLKRGPSGEVQAGRLAVVVGHQAGQPGAAAITLVSGIRREGSFAGTRFYPELIQVSGVVGAGASGAPLLNSRAEVIGMLVAIAVPASGEKPSAQGLGGYALPIDFVGGIVKRMAHVKMYLRSWLGADLREEARAEQRPDGSLPVRRSVWVEAVHPGSPARAAGLQRGDHLISMNGRPIERMAEVRTAIVYLEPDQKLKFLVRRAGKDVALLVPFATRPRDAGSGSRGRP